MSSGKSDDIVVSIIVPVFNAEKYINRFVNYILNQDYKYWELIIVDDGSIDGTVSLVEKAMEKDARIKLYRRNRDPKGSATCRNIGQQAASGEYFIHLDCDDIIAPFLIRQRLKFMIDHPEIDYASAYGKTLTLHGDGSLTYHGKTYGNNPKKDLLKCFLDNDYPFSVWNNIYRSSSFKEIYWNEKVKIRTDFSYIVPVIISGFKHAFIEMSDPDYYYVKGIDGAITTNYTSKDKVESTYYLFQKTLNQIASLPETDKYKKIFRSCFTHQLVRLVAKGSKKQVNDFYLFYLSCYKNFSIRLKVVYFLVLSREKRYPESLMKLLMYTILKPSRLGRFCIGLIQGLLVRNKPFTMPS